MKNRKSKLLRSLTAWLSGASLALSALSALGQQWTMGPETMGDIVFYSINGPFAAKDGDLYACGNSYNGQYALIGRSVYRWTRASGVWTPVGNFRAGDYPGYPAALTIRGNYLYVAGGFDVVGAPCESGLTAVNVARMDFATGEWSAVGSLSGSGWRASSVAVDSAGRVYIGETTSAYGSGEPEPTAVRVFDGSSWAPLADGLRIGPYSWGDGVTALAVDANDDLYVGGNFTSGLDGNSEVASVGIIKWKRSTQEWLSMASQIDLDQGAPAIFSIAVLGNRVFATGIFNYLTDSGLVEMSTAGAFVRGYRLCYSYAPEDASGFGFGLVVQNDAVFMTGAFDQIEDTSGLNAIAKMGLNGTTWEPLDEGLRVAVDPDSPGTGVYLAADPSAVFVAGNFYYAGGTAVPNVAVWSVPAPSGVVSWWRGENNEGCIAAERSGASKYAIG